MCIRDSSGSVLEGEGDFVGGDGAFAEDHPGVCAAGEVDDGGGDGAGGGAAIDDEGDLVAELVGDVLGAGALGHAAEAVSYTHLDVYKRQISDSGPVALRGLSESLTAGRPSTVMSLQTRLCLLYTSTSLLCDDRYRPVGEA